MWGDVDDLEKWIVENSKGFAPFPSYETRGLDAKFLKLIETFRFGGFARIIERHRAKGVVHPDLKDLIELVSSVNDVENYHVFRGMSSIKVPKIGSTHTEQSLNSWSIYPSIALRIAFAVGEEPFVILRRRMEPHARGLYLDEFEEEVLCPPGRFKIGQHISDTVNFLGDEITVTMVDCSLER